MYTKVVLFLVIPYVLGQNILSVDKPIVDGFGVNIHFTHPKPGELEMIREAGFKWVRVDLFWERTEKVKGVYNFSDYEFLLQRLKEHNMSVYYILDYSNKLYESNQSVVTESGRQAYAKWAATAIQHFKGKGILWEMWNEPNGNGFWGGHPNPQQYSQMALEAMKEIRKQSPNEIVVGPTTAGVDMDYLEVCLRSGLLEYWDAVSVHPYRQNSPETVTSDYFALRQMIARYAPKGKHIPIVSGEWGYSAVWKHFNETIQGQYLQRELLTNVMHNIPNSIWYDWHNDGTNETYSEDNFGLVNYEYKTGKSPVYEPKDAYITAKLMNTVLNGFTFVHRIATNDTNDYVLLFRNEKKELHLAVWSSTGTVENPHNISIPSDKCDFEIIHHKGTPVQKASASGGSVVLSLNDFVHFIVVKCSNNKALETAPDSNEFAVTVMLNQGEILPIQVTHIYGAAQNVTLRLTDVKGFQLISNETEFAINNEMEETLKLKVKSKLSRLVTLGVTVEYGKQSVQFGPYTYNYTSDDLLGDCIVTPDGNNSIKSEQSLSVQTAPEKVFGADIKALKFDYHFYGRKFLDVFPKSSEYQGVSGEPKSISFWIYGDKQSMVFKMRISDKNGQVFQLRPLSNHINWMGWRYVTIKMTDIEIHWNGPNDGHIKYPVKLSTMFLLENVQEAEVKGTLYISSPIISY